MMKISSKQKELIKLYEEMANDGYDLADGRRVEVAYNGFGLRRYRNPVKKVLLGNDVDSVLDYGCGGSNWEEMKIFDGLCAKDFFSVDEVKYYEPARNIDQRSMADAVVCFDVLEHIFITDIPDVLKDIYKYAKKIVVINAACYNALALLPTGENAHITVRPPSWSAGMVRGISSEFPSIDTHLFCTTGDNKLVHKRIESVDECVSKNGFAR